MLTLLRRGHGEEWSRLQISGTFPPSHEAMVDRCAWTSPTSCSLQQEVLIEWVPCLTLA